MARSRHTSGRSFLTPSGNSERPFVREGNLLSARVAILIHVAAARGLKWFLEQPSGTILAHMPWFQSLWAEVEAAYREPKRYKHQTIYRISCLHTFIFFISTSQKNMITYMYIYIYTSMNIAILTQHPFPLVGMFTDQ